MIGVIVIAGEVNRRRVPLLRRLVRCKPATGTVAFRAQLLKEAVSQIMQNQVVVVDAEFDIAELQAANVSQYVVRMAPNCTARRNQLVLPNTPAAPDAATFSIYVYHDPLYQHPLVLATNLVNVQPQTVFRICRDRWPVKQPPLSAKQMIGLHRQFVFALASCFRLPELSLLAGAILTYLAAVLPPVPSGFWDRSPKPTPGHLRRLLAQTDFPTLLAEDRQLRKKSSVTAHLP